MTNNSNNQQYEDSRHASPEQTNCWLRWMLLGFGWLNVTLGLIGIIVPGLPTTVFLIVAAWAFSKSSERFRLWLWNHPRFGSSIRNWHDYKVIPYRAKIMASAMMAVSFVVVLVMAEDMTLPFALLAVMVPAALYVNTRASEIPLNVRSEQNR
jgi:uncharacterized protein